ncbi:MAG TPA: molybdopterin-guanine dinucleotide biosynthesis protein B [Candidatus Methanoperedenaceae archaeon]|nr:molybdopterin-guanine dinucleotide biosynthesis protein B [Candidatus Methanoperedenaceae archaeon]
MTPALKKPVMAPVICIVGKSGSGKTRLMTGLIRELKARGKKVGAIKHHAHGDFEIDIEGKDTWKFAEAGADSVAISSPVKFAVINRVEAELPPDALCEYMRGLDVVLAEGFTLSGEPRIIIAGSGEDVELFSRGRDVVAVVGKDGLNDIIGIADRVEEFLKTG